LIRFYLTTCEYAENIEQNDRIELKQPLNFKPDHVWHLYCLKKEYE